MNILLFVLTLLLVMSSISYQALNRYQTGALLRSSWDKSMRVDAICQYNALVEAEYEFMRKNGGTKTSEEEREVKKAGEEKEAEGNATIDFRFISDPKYPELYPKEFPLMQEVLEKLILTLYSDMPYLQGLLEKRPQAVIELFDALRSANADLPEKQRYNSVKKLIKIPLKDKELDTLRYELLRNSPVSKNVMKVLNFKARGSKDDDKNECVEVSLKDYLNTRKKKKIRVYLAPRAILYAIFADASVVENLVEFRNGLHSDVTSKEDKKENKDASQELREFCLSLPGTHEFEPILDFTVTSTNPKKYEE